MPKKPKAPTTVMEWLAAEGAVERVRYDQDTGQPYRSFEIDLTKPDKPARPISKGEL